MKKKFVLITLAIIATFCLALGGCKEGIDTEYGRWYIEKSPITGRYYEVYSAGYGKAMSEVTEQEYLKYLEMIGEE